MESSKICKVCDRLLPLSSYRDLPHTFDGKDYRCADCARKYGRAYRLKKVWEKCDPLILDVFKDAPVERLRRFAPKVEVVGACWIWQGQRHPDTGYGRLWRPGSKHTQDLAHRLAYEWAVGPIPEGLVIDHLCRNRPCVNPEHLEPVTPVENVMRGMSIWAVNARKTHCKRGHPLSGENLIANKAGTRECRECRNAAKRARRAATGS